MSGTSEFSPRTLLGSVVGWVGGWALSQYTGAALWIPGGVAVVASLVFAKSELRPAHFAGAAAVVLGHLAWFVVSAVAGGTWLPVFVDVVVLGAGLVWLWTRPGLAPAITLAAYEFLALMSNGVAILAVAVGSAEHRALTVHCLFRVLALATLAFGYWNLRKAPSAPETRNPDALVHQQPTNVSGQLPRLLLVGVGVVAALLGVVSMVVMVSFIRQTHASVAYAVPSLVLIVGGTGCLFWAERIRRRMD